MRQGRVEDAHGQVLLHEVWRTTNAWERGRGLLARPALNPGQGLWIDRCGSIHTWGMRYVLDVVFMNDEGVVLKVVGGLCPFRFAMARGARRVLELPAGTPMARDLAPGRALRWREWP